MRRLADPLHQGSLDMPAAITSKQWLTRLGLIGAVAGSEVIVLAVAGLGALRLAVVAVSALVFAIAYVLAPSGGKPHYDRAQLRPVLAMSGAALVAIGASGGLASPVLPLVAAPMTIAWTMMRPRDARVVLAVWPLAVALVLAAVTRELPAVGFTVTAFAVVAAWSTAITGWIVGRRVLQLSEVVRGQSRCLAQVREGALSDAAGRRRGLESMTTKLAHELKNPLAAIKSLVQVELGRAGDDKARRRLEVALGETERIGAILREYLDLARPIEDVRIAPVQLDEIVEEVTSLLAGRAEGAGVELALAGEGGTLRCDRRLLKEALVNVTSNAIEATPRGGFVTLAYHVGTAGANITIRDTGRGMSKDVAARVGTPFYTTREGGSGLGVVIARAAIAQHGGTLEYTSTPGIGTIATIALPIDPRAKERAA